MKQNQSLNHTEPVKKGRAHFKFSLFSSSSDLWILAIALLILLFLSFMNERQMLGSSLKQIPDQSENNILQKNHSTGINTAMAKETTGIITKKG